MTRRFAGARVALALLAPAALGYAAGAAMKGDGAAFGPVPKEPWLLHDSPGEDVTLRGLPGVGVMVRFDNPDAQYPPPERVRADVEDQLRRGGIRVLGGRELDRADGQPLLLVTVVLGQDNGFHGGIVLYQNARLARDARIGVRAITWGTNIAAPWVGEKILDGPAQFGGALSEAVGEFVETYGAQNP